MTNKKFGMLRKLTGAFLSAIMVLLAGISTISFADNTTCPAFNADIVTASFSKKNSIQNHNINKIDISDEVYAGGFPFGVKLYSKGLIIIGFTDIESSSGIVSPAKDAGMRINDIITEINNKKISNANEFMETVENSKGKKVAVSYIRDNKEYNCSITPSLSDSDGKYKVGLWLRDSTAGIGTVTFVSPQNGVFAGLGHGICDSETGALIPLSRGIVSDVKIEGIKKGVSGSPGELQGTFKGGVCGELLNNTINGIFGVFTDHEKYSKDKVKLGTKDEIVEGEATIMCTLCDNKIGKYKIKISEIHRDSTGNKNFVITVTDKALIEKTGGIVQGMSGSPIIQNDKLIGAVTHVLINDPTKGYGIFIENMLNAVR